MVIVHDIEVRAERTCLTCSDKAAENYADVEKHIDESLKGNCVLCV